MLSSEFVLFMFFITLVIAILSGLIFLNHQVPIQYIKFHIYLLVLPIIAGLSGLIFFDERVNVGPFVVDHLTWLMMTFILTLGFIIQKFSMRYLIGDMHYRKYFPFLTLITVFASLAWLSGDLRLMTMFWGATLFVLTRLIKVNKLWKVPREAARISARSFTLAWLSLLIAVILLYIATGDWYIHSNMSDDNAINYGMRLCINLLIVLAVIIPAAQFPFQGWLIESVAAPTPVSAIMHAGIVLLIIASISVLLGSGISLVHVDYKRQLVGSTISQMGFMLVQCALGAYSAAIVHLILHGVFKATLFLQSGSVVKRFNIPTPPSVKKSYGWLVFGRLLAILIAIIFWLNSDRHAYDVLSALILAWSLMVSWNQLVAFSHGLIGRIIGICMIIVVAIVYIITHHYFFTTLSTVDIHIVSPPSISIFLSIAILVFGSMLSIWVARRRESKAFAKLYLWLIKVGEAKTQSIESHPSYLKRF
ncbi:MAG: NADH dehydrogenase subunit 5 [Staphylococcus epidermidis]|nr:NADH dehydrogenase subunit 5 [Staphylococcus epidermidis]